MTLFHHSAYAAAALLTAALIPFGLGARSTPDPYTDPPVPTCNRVVPFDVKTIGSTARLSADDVFHMPGVTPELIEQITHFYQNACTFAVNDWYNKIKDYDAQDPRHPIDFREVKVARGQEARYRPGSHMCRALATALVLNVYDEKRSGKTRAEAASVAVRLAESAAARYRQGLWGRGWQDALWASEYAMGAWLLWDRLSDTGRADVRSMVERECDSFLTRPLPYYKNAAGKVLSPGDSKSEEHAWNSSILHLGLLMMPHHERASAWGKRLTEILLIAYARPEDTVSDEKVGGLVLKQVLRGSNLNSDGTVINHRRIHPDYMTSNMLSVNALLNGCFAPHGPMPKAAIFNLDRVYTALCELDIGKYNRQMAGRHFYGRTPDGKPSTKVNYPVSNDWGASRQACFALEDALAAAFGADKHCTFSGIEWLKVRMPEMLRMQTRLPSFQYYQSDKEDRFFSREEWIAQHACMLYLTFWMKREGFDRRISDRPLFTE